MSILLFINILIKLIIPIVFLIAGYFIGSKIEKNHYLSIIERENDLKNIIMIASKYPPESAKNAQLVFSNVVVGSDVFKRFVAALIGFFGGRISTYETILDRARREAVIRMKLQAKQLGANMIVNLKFETAVVGYSNKTNKSAICEVTAYGTAVKYSDESL